MSELKRPVSPSPLESPPAKKRRTFWSLVETTHTDSDKHPDSHVSGVWLYDTWEAAEADIKDKKENFIWSRVRDDPGNYDDYVDSNEDLLYDAIAEDLDDLIKGEYIDALVTYDVVPTDMPD